MALIDISKFAGRKSAVQGISQSPAIRQIGLSDVHNLGELYKDRIGNVGEVIDELVSFALSEIEAFNEKHEFANILYKLGCDRDVMTTQLLARALPRIPDGMEIIASGEFLKMGFKGDLIRLIGFSGDWGEDFIRHEFFDEDADLTNDLKVNTEVAKRICESDEFKEYVSDFENTVCSAVMGKAEQLLSQEVNLKSSDNFFAFGAYKGFKDQLKVFDMSKMVSESSYVDTSLQYNCSIQTVLHAIAHVRFRSVHLDTFKEDLLQFADEDTFMASSELPLIDELSPRNRATVALFLRQFASDLTEEEFKSIRNLNYKVHKDWSEAKLEGDVNALQYICKCVKPGSPRAYIYSQTDTIPAKYISSKNGYVKRKVSFEPIDTLELFNGILFVGYISKFSEFVLSVFKRQDGSLRDLSIYVDGGRTILQVNPDFPFIGRHHLAPILRIDQGVYGIEERDDDESTNEETTYKAKLTIAHSSFI